MAGEIIFFHELEYIIVKEDGRVPVYDLSGSRKIWGFCESIPDGIKVFDKMTSKSPRQTLKNGDEQALKKPHWKLVGVTEERLTEDIRKFALERLDIRRQSTLRGEKWREVHARIEATLKLAEQNFKSSQEPLRFLRGANRDFYTDEDLPKT